MSATIVILPVIGRSALVEKSFDSISKSGEACEVGRRLSIEITLQIEQLVGGAVQPFLCSDDSRGCLPFLLIPCLPRFGVLRIHSIVAHAVRMLRQSGPVFFVAVHDSTQGLSDRMVGVTLGNWQEFVDCLLNFVLGNSGALEGSSGIICIGAVLKGGRDGSEELRGIDETGERSLYSVFLPGHDVHANGLVHIPQSYQRGGYSDDKGEERYPIFEQQKQCRDSPTFTHSRSSPRGVALLSAGRA